jgi:hypothetical protein
MCNWTSRPLGKDFARGWHDTTRDGDRDDGPRVLFESPDGAEAHATWKLLQRDGYRVTWCPGPQGGFSSECALTTIGHCSLVDEADVVVSALDLRDPSSQEVVRGLNEAASHTPVVVVASRGAAPRWADELPDCTVLSGPLSSKVLRRSVSLAHPAGRAVPVS